MRIKVTAPSREELSTSMAEAEDYAARLAARLERPDVLTDFAGNPVDVPAVLRAIASIDWSRTAGAG
jgi:hypothetical protein